VRSIGELKVIGNKYKTSFRDSQYFLLSPKSEISYWRFPLIHGQNFPLRYPNILCNQNGINPLSQFRAWPTEFSTDDCSDNDFTTKMLSMHPES
jgi:hypothetical protein